MRNIFLLGPKTLLDALYTRLYLTEVISRYMYLELISVSLRQMPKTSRKGTNLSIIYGYFSSIKLPSVAVAQSANPAT